jgi:hypothetical protein
LVIWQRRGTIHAYAQTVDFHCDHRHLAPAGGNGLVSWAEQFIPSGVAALIIGSMPMFLVVAEAIAPKRRKTDTGKPSLAC